MNRKFTATQIFDGNHFLPEGKVLVNSAEGEIIDIISIDDAGDDIEHFDGILSPGFINCHCHLELSHMKGIIAEKTGLVNFVQQVMTQRTATDEQKGKAMEAAEKEMYQNGIVAVGDICNTTDSIEVKKSSKIKWNNFIEVSGFVDSAAQKRFNDASIILAEFKNKLKDQYASLSPHAPYSVSKTLFGLLNDATASNLITIHNQESAEEDKLYQNRSGGFLNLYKNFGIGISSFEPTNKSSLQTWLPYFTEKQSILSVHDTFIKQADLDLVKLSTFNFQFSTVLCPTANLYIENTLPDVELLQKNGLNIALGTDSYASNHQLSIWEEIRILQKYFPVLSLETLLQWATTNGAKAMRIDNQFGSFEKGKKPGIVFINKDQNKIKRLL